MMSSLSNEELNAQRSDFGLRLSNSMAKYGPLCVGIDPHRQLLIDWGYNVDALGKCDYFYFIAYDITVSDLFYCKFKE